jgi:hypothetical protein
MRSKPASATEPSRGPTASLFRHDRNGQLEAATALRNRPPAIFKCMAKDCLADVRAEAESHSGGQRQHARSCGRSIPAG